VTPCGISLFSGVLQFAGNQTRQPPLRGETAPLRRDWAGAARRSWEAMRNVMRRK